MPKINFKQKFVSPILMWLIVIVGIYLTVKLAPAGAVFGKNVFTSLFIAPAALYWLYFFGRAIKANRQAGRSVAGVTQIIGSGIYGIVRHPIYSADIVLAWGVFLYQPSLKVLISVVWLTIVLLFWMKLEEKFLLQKFGSAYIDYQKQVPMVIPKIIKKPDGQ